MTELETKLAQIKTQKDTYLIPGNIRKNVTILNVTGTYEGSGTDTSDATAYADDIISDKTAYARGSKITGAIIPTYVGSGFVLPYTYTDGNRTVVINNLPATTTKHFVMQDWDHNDWYFLMECTDENFSYYKLYNNQWWGYDSSDNRISDSSKYVMYKADHQVAEVSWYFLQNGNNTDNGWVTAFGGSDTVCYNSDGTLFYEYPEQMTLISLQRNGTLYRDTADANAVANDIKSGKTAYVNGTKITGTMTEVINPASVTGTTDGRFFKPSDASGGGSGCYTIRATTGQDTGTDFLVNWITVTSSNRWFIDNQTKVKAGIPFANIASAANLTPDKIKNGVTILGVTGTYGSGDEKFYVPNGTKFSNSTFNTIPVDWDFGNVMDFSTMFRYCNSLTSLAGLDTHQATTLNYLCQQSGSPYALTTVPRLDTSNVQTMTSAFSGCRNLTDASLNNIMGMCIDATNYTGTKSLTSIGLSATQRTTCQSLSNYQDLINAGWTA